MIRRLPGGLGAFNITRAFVIETNGVESINACATVHSYLSRVFFDVQAAVFEEYTPDTYELSSNYSYQQISLKISIRIMITKIIE